MEQNINHPLARSVGVRWILAVSTMMAARKHRDRHPRTRKIQI